MRITTMLIASVLTGCTLLGQGTVNFNNAPSAVGGAGARFYDMDGTTPLAGTAFLAQLYAGPNEGSLAPIGAALPFRTGAGAGFVDTAAGTARTISTVAPGAVATVQIRFWGASSGATWEAALAAGGKVGLSPSILVTTGGSGEPPSLPANLVGLMAAQIMIPEPGSIALGLLGAGALLLRRRK